VGPSSEFARRQEALRSALVFRHHPDIRWSVRDVVHNETTSAPRLSERGLKGGRLGRGSSTTRRLSLRATRPVDEELAVVSSRKT